jgi:hypothetical protein
LDDLHLALHTSFEVNSIYDVATLRWYCQAMGTTHEPTNQKLPDYLVLNTSGPNIQLDFDTTGDIVYTIGDHLEQIEETAYMTGFNWAHLIDYFIDERIPEIRTEINITARSGGFTATWANTPENQTHAQHLAQLITELITQPEQLYQTLTNLPLDTFDFGY